MLKINWEDKISKYVVNGSFLIDDIVYFVLKNKYYMQILTLGC